MVFFSALNYCLTLISPAGLNDLIYTLIQTPLKHMGTNIFAVIILGAVGNFLWVLGIHGPNTTSAIRETVFSEANLENLSWAAQHGTTWGAPYPITWTSINDAFANCGGSGMTLGLLLAIFIASKRAEYRDLAKMSFIPGIFNINEPIMFGLPIVLNPIMMVPFIMVPIVNCAIGYFFVSMEIIPQVCLCRALDYARTFNCFPRNRGELAGFTGWFFMFRCGDNDLFTFCYCRQQSQ